MTALTPDPRQRQKDARARAGRIRLGITDYIQTLGWIAQARAENDHITLGYDSWQAYVDGEYGEARIQLPADMRRKAVEELRLAGASQREIGHTVGVSQTQVRRDLAEPKGSPEPARSPLVEAMTGAIEDATDRAQTHRSTPGDEAGMPVPADPEPVGLPPATDEVPVATESSTVADAAGPGSAPGSAAPNHWVPVPSEADDVSPSAAESAVRSSHGFGPALSAPDQPASSPFPSADAEGSVPDGPSAPEQERSGEIRCPTCGLVVNRPERLP